MSQQTVTIYGMELTKAQLEEGLRLLEEKRVAEERRTVPFMSLSGEYVAIPIGLVESAMQRMTIKTGGFIKLHHNGMVNWDNPNIPYGSPFKGFKQ